MSIVWQQRIRHFDRAVKPTKMRGMRLQMLKAEVRKKRKLPSQGHSGEYVFGSLEVRRKKRRGEDTTQAEKKLLFMRLRERMLWRKRLERRLAERSRRPSVSDTKINLAKRRRDYLAAQDAMRAEWAANDLEFWQPPAATGVDEGVE